MKKFTKIVLLAFIFLYVPLVAYASYKDEGNDGSSSKPYVIDSVEDLQELQKGVNNGTEEAGKYYKLSTNLDIKSITNWLPIGNDRTKPFKGHFNGNGKNISVNMKSFYNNTNNMYIGSALFGYIDIEGTAVKNLTINGSIEGRTYAAGIASILVNGTIDNCNFTGSIYGWRYGYAAMAGGIVGQIINGTVKNCTVYKGTVYATTDSTDSDKQPYAGGIIGFMSGGVVQSCEVKDNSIVQANKTYAGYTGYVGGIVGAAKLNNTTKEGIFSCQVQGTVTSNTEYIDRVVYCGGIIGSLSGGIVKSCKVLTGSQISVKMNKKYDSTSYSSILGGIAGELTMNGIIQSCTVQYGVNIDMQLADVTLNQPALGGIIGAVRTGTVKSNAAYGTLTGNAVYSGGVIGRITESVTTISGNKFSNAEYGIGSDYYNIPSDEGCTGVSAPTINTETLANGFLKQKYSKTLSASGTKTITWKKANGTLPTGLSLSSEGKITGTPTKEGTFKFTVKATNAAGYATKSLTITISKSVVITSTTLENGSIDTPYNVQLAADGTPSITWSKTKGSLPTGLKLSKKGQIVGVPTKTGTFSFTVKAKNNYGSATKALKIVIKAGKPAITTTSLPDGYMGSVYNVQLQASGTAPFTWTKSGTLPSGIVLAKSGQLIGIPTKTGEFTVTFKATNTLGSASKKLTLKIMAEEEEETNTTSKNKSKDKDSSDENQTNVITGEGIKFGEDRTTASIPQSILNSISNDKKMIAAILPEVTVNEYGLYVFEGVSLDSKVPEGWNLTWHSYPKDNLNSSEADENDTAEFFDDEGDTLSEVPENHNVNVSVGLDTGIYYPLIIAEAEENSSEDSSGSSGCNMGFNSLLLLAGFWIVRRKR